MKQLTYEKLCERWIKLDTTQTIRHPYKGRPMSHKGFLNWKKIQTRKDKLLSKIQEMS